MLNEVGEAKTPVPLVVHCPPVAFVTVPLTDVFALFAQTVWFVPASTTGAGSKERTILSDVGKQIPVDVKVKVTEPTLKSEKLGVYSALKLVASSKVPEPELVHIPVVAPPVTEPLNIAGTLAQVVKSTPASVTVSATNSEK